MSRIYVVAFFSLILNAGCNNQLNSYVSNIKPPSLTAPAPSAPGSLELEGRIGAKFSPGHVIGAGTATGIRAGVTVNQFTGQGQTIGVRAAISRAPANQ